MPTKPNPKNASTVLGLCAYCGQSRATDPNEDGTPLAQEEANQIATEACTCEVARAARKIAELFVGQDDEAIELVQKAAKLVFAHDSEAFTLKFDERVKVGITRTKKDKLVVKRTMTDASTAQF